MKIITATGNQKLGQELSKKYDYIIVNDDLNKTVKDLEKIIND